MEVLMSILGRLFPKSRDDAPEQLQTEDGRVQMKITNTAPPAEELFEAELPAQPTTDIKTYLRTTPRVKPDTEADNG
jgi:hypothetical protein